jgi:hypothetical protein
MYLILTNQQKNLSQPYLHQLYANEKKDKLFVTQLQVISGNGSGFACYQEIAFHAFIGSPLLIKSISDSNDRY